VNSNGGTTDILEQEIDRLNAKVATLELSAQCCKTTLQSIGDAVISVDTAGKIVLMNPAAEALTGWSQTEASGLPLSDVYQIVSEETGSRQENPVERVLRDGASVKLANHSLLIARSGNARPIADSGAPICDVQGKVNGAVLVFRDQTAERATLRALRESESRFRNMFENSPLGKSITDVAGGLNVNQAMASLLGHSKEELCSKTWQDITHPEDIADTSIQIQALIDGEKDQVRFEKRYIHKNGTVVWGDVTSAMQRDLRGKPLYLITTIVDVTERKRAEESVLRTQNLLNETQRITKVGGWEYDVGTRQASWTDEVYNIHALTRDYDPSNPAKDMEFYAPHEKQKIVEAFTRAVENGEPYDLELQFINARQEKLWVRTIGQVECVGDKVVRVFGNIMDITERRQAEIWRKLALDVLATLNRSSSEFDAMRAVVDLVKQGLGFEAVGIRFRDSDDFPYYVTTGFPGRFVQLERSLCGHDKNGEVIRDEQGRPILECMCGNVICGKTDPKYPFFTEGGSFWTNGTSELLATTSEQERQSNTRNRCNKEGYESVALVPLRSNERTVGLLQLNDRRPNQFTLALIQFLEGLCDSIGIELGRKQAEVELAERQVLHQNLLESAGNAIFSLDRTCRYTSFNKQHSAVMKALYGVEIERGHRIFDYQAATQDHVQAKRNIDRALTGEHLVDEGFSGDDARTRAYFEVSHHPIYDHVDNIVGVAVFARDTTAQRRAEEELRVLNAELDQRVSERTVQLEESNKELDAFSYSVSHDLRAPLRAIDGFTRILSDEHASGLNDEAKRLCSIIRENTKRMSRLIDDLLAFSRMGRASISRSPVDMRAMANAVFHELTTTESRLRIDFELGSLPETAADSTLMRQVWTNLLSNAIKFSSKRERAEIRVGAESSEAGQFYSVSDNGVGFDMQYRDKLFGVFQRLHSTKEFEGTGVGLALVQRIIHRHGGRVWANGEVDRGAAIYFSLQLGEK